MAFCFMVVSFVLRFLAGHRRRVDDCSQSIDERVATQTRRSFLLRSRVASCCANLNEILIIMAVVDEGSFIAGGQTMGLSRSAAGKAVSRLEDRLGVRLLHRSTRGLSLTDEGRVFYTGA